MFAVGALPALALLAGAVAAFATRLARLRSRVQHNKSLLIAHGTPAEVQRALDFMSAGDPERIDAHTEAVPAT